MRERDGLAVRGPPPLDPSTVLRVSGSSLGRIPVSGDGDDGELVIICN